MAAAVPHVPSPRLRGEGAGRRMRGKRAKARRQTPSDCARAKAEDRENLPPYRLRLPKIPRTMARPTELATERAALFMAASMTVSR